MANLYKPTYSKLDPKTGKRVLRKVRKWYGKYRDADGVVRKVPLSEDKTAAVAMLTELFRKAQWQQAGLRDPAADHLEAAVTAHVDDYRSHLEARARNEKHIGETVRVINNIVSACRFEVLADLQAGGERIEKHLGQRRAAGASHRTVNADLTAIRSFCRWLMQRQRMHNDPTVGLQRLNEEVDPRTERRALSGKEAQRLIETTHRSKRIFRRLSGQDRAMLYLLAQRTGLRRGELRHLTPQSFDFSATPAMVTVPAARSKRRRTDRLPLSPDVAKAMNEFLDGRPVDELIWPGSWWQQSAKMLKRDLADAAIPVVDKNGRVVDFHGQRTTFITELARAGVPPATAQKLARHSDVNLTMGTYTRLEMSELADAVNRLPTLKTSRKRPQARRADSADELLIDPDVREVAEAWPRLTDEVRRAIMKLIGDGADPVT